jgi:GDP-4-dehydro-6-deoxy-D-mannose reductase
VDRVLVTGSAGFVGRHLLDRLAADNVTVSELSGDIRDGAALRTQLAAATPDAIVHLAAASSVASSWRERRETWDVNVTGTLELLLAIEERCPGARVLVVSSAEVYGAVPADHQPIDEGRVLAPASPYGASKAAAEQAVAATRLDAVIARPFPHIGPGQSETFALPSFAAQIARIERGESEPVLRVGNLEARRDLTDVRDVVDAYVRLLGLAEPAPVYNVARGHAIAIGEALERLLALSQVPIRIEVDPSRLRPSDIALLSGDAARLRADTGWQPTRELDRSLADLLASFRNQGVHA